MVSLEKQKKALFWVAGFGLLLGASLIAGAIVLLYFGITSLMRGDVNPVAITQIVLGVIMGIFGPAVFIWGFRGIFLGVATKNLNGSTAEGNRAKVGTINMKKCPNCGAEVKEGDKCCGKCGHSLSDKKVCPKCGCTNTAENKKCSNCGADLD